VCCYISTDLPDIDDGDEDVNDNGNAAKDTDQLDETSAAQLAANVEHGRQCYVAEVSCTVDNAVGNDDDVDLGSSAKGSDKNTCRSKRRIKKVVEDYEETSKIERRRWSSSEMKQLFASFGSQITRNALPSGEQVNEFAKLIGYSRTVPQIRAQLSNIMSGKVKCHTPQ